MKKSNLISITSLLLIFIASCYKSEIDPSRDLERKTISAKWIVDNSNVYKSFEFNESGNFIIVENKTTKSATDQEVHFGIYNIVDDKTIVLSDFGNLTISGIDENSISFSIRLNGNPDNEILIDASKQEEMEGSARTELLCRTWEMVSENGEPVAGTNMELTVLYSRAGTYFVSFVNPPEDNEGGIAHWKWKDNKETHLLYSWDEVPYWNEDHSVVEILELTSTSLKMVEYGDVWMLKPVLIR